jgi:hypothetical protein
VTERTREIPNCRQNAIIATAALCLLLSSCSHSPSGALQARYQEQNNISAFLVCSEYNCSTKHWISLSDTEWSQVRSIFEPVALDAGDERERIRGAVAMIETLVGPKAGTDIDRAGAAIFTLDKQGQLDCIDEAYNTTTYLRLLDADNLIRFHEIGEPARRGYIFNRWPHNTATVAEHGTGASYAVDSWFGANGELPDVVSLQSWLDGWSPSASSAS